MTKRQLKRRKRRALLAQKLRRYPHWTRRKIIHVLLKQDDQSMYPRELMAVFGVFLPTDIAESNRLYESVDSAVKGLIAEKKLMWVSGPKLRLTAGVWLTYTRGRMDEALVS